MPILLDGRQTTFGDVFDRIVRPPQPIQSSQSPQFRKPPRRRNEKSCSLSMTLHFPKVAVEEHIILPSQLQHVHWPTKALEDRQADLLEYAERRSETMRHANIQISILSAFSDGLQALPPCSTSRQAAETWNIELHAIAQTNSRFRCFAALPMCDPVAAANETRKVLYDDEVLWGAHQRSRYI